MFTFAVIVALFLIACTFSDAFMMPGSRWMQTSSQTKNLNRLSMADVELTFPNGKKAKVPAGSAMKDAAKKAGFSPNYGCEEGKCGSCELKVNGKTKIRPCIGKVPASATPIKLDNL